MVEYLLNFPGGHEQLRSDCLYHSLSDTLPRCHKVKTNWGAGASPALFSSLPSTEPCLTVTYTTGGIVCRSKCAGTSSLEKINEKPIWQTVSAIIDNDSSFPLWYSGCAVYPLSPEPAAPSVSNLPYTWRLTRFSTLRGGDGHTDPNPTVTLWAEYPLKSPKFSSLWRGMILNPATSICIAAKLDSHDTMQTGKNARETESQPNILWF